MTQGEVSKTMEVMRKSIATNLKDVHSAIKENKKRFLLSMI